jgi:ribose transport system substrate-binding protein
MRRSVLLLMAVVLVCGGMIPAAVSAQEPYNMSLLIGALDNPYWITMQTAAEKAAAELGVNLTVLGTTEEGGVAQQVSQMEDRIAAGDDLILIAARSGEAIVPAVAAAMEAGVPVIAVDSPPASGEWAGTIKTDNSAGGYLGGQWLADQIGGTGKVLVLEGLPGLPASDDRRDGALAALAEYPDIEATTLVGDFATAKGQSVTEDVLTANPDLVGIACGNDMMAIGAQAAVAAAGLEDQVFIVGYDAVPPALELIAGGQLGATVAQFPDKMGDLGVKFGVRVLEGKEIPTDVDSGTLLITQDNVLEFALANAPLEATEAHDISLMIGALDNPYWITMQKSAEKAASDLGVNLTVLGTTQEGGVAEQVSQVEDRLAAGADLILIAARSGEAIVPAVAAATEAGVPVIAVDSPPASGEWAGTIKTDNFTGGYLGGQWIAEQVGGAGQVLVLEGLPGLPASDDRRDGALAALAEYPDIEASVLVGDFATAKGQSVTEDVLTAKPDLVGIACGNDMMCMGSQTAVAAAGLEDQVFIVGYDAVPPALELIADGRMGASVAQFPGKMGALGVAYAVTVLEGGEIPELVDSGTMLVTKDNVDLFIDGVYGF